MMLCSKNAGNWCGVWCIVGVKVKDPEDIILDRAYVWVSTTSKVNDFAFDTISLISAKVRI